MTIDEGAIKLIPIAEDLAAGDRKKAAYMLLTATICLAPDKDNFMPALNRMFDQIEEAETR